MTVPHPTLTFLGGRDVTGRYADSVVWSLERLTADTMQWHRPLKNDAPVGAPPRSRIEWRPE